MSFSNDGQVVLSNEADIGSTCTDAAEKSRVQDGFRYVP